MTTYYSDIKNLSSIHNPLIDNSVLMRYSGFLEEVKNDQTPYFGTSLKKTLQNQGRIFCDDASRLFSITEGNVNLTLSFPFDINSGVLSKLRFSNSEYMLWAVNMGQIDIGNPGIGAFLTNRGIEFKIKTSGGSYSLIDDSTLILADTFFEIEFLWRSQGIQEIDENPTMAIRVNKNGVVGSTIPIIDDSVINSGFYSAIGQAAPTSTNVFEDVQFQILDNIFNFNNLPCSISRITIGNTIPDYI